MSNTLICVAYTQGAGPETLSLFLPTLSPAQQSRINSIKVSEKRLQSLCAHLLARHCLEQYFAGHTPPELCFAASGKPVLPGSEGVYISLSHTRGAVAAAVSDMPIGVDIEGVRAVRPSVEKLFSPQELSLFPEYDRSRRLLALWTRREAQFKCTGESTVRRAPSRSVDSNRMLTRELDGGERGFILSVCAGSAFKDTPRTEVLQLYELISLLQ